ncbi:MAG: 30S ribosome-binding factor RbfA [Acidimicrobiia bacterium]
MTTPRMLKVNSILREVIADELEKMNDSRLELVSVTAVDTAPNLRKAVVFVDAIAKDPEEVLEALRATRPRLQREIGRQVRIKYTPILEFDLDTGVMAGERIEQILRELKSDEEE